VYYNNSFKIVVDNKGLLCYVNYVVKAKHPGRPVKTAKDRRSKILQVRLTPDEFKTIEAVAREKVTDVSTWARSAIVHAARQEQSQD